MCPSLKNCSIPDIDKIFSFSTSAVLALCQGGFLQIKFRKEVFSLPAKNSVIIFIY